MKCNVALHFVFFACEAIRKGNKGGEMRTVKDGDSWNLKGKGEASESNVLPK